MTDRTGVDVEGKWPDGFDIDAWESLLYEDADGIRRSPGIRSLLDWHAHSLVTRHNRNRLQVGTIPIADETGRDRHLVRVMCSYVVGGHDVTDDFAIEPEPEAASPDAPAPAANVWWRHTDPTTAPDGAVPTTLYIPDQNRTVMGVTEEYEEGFDAMLAGPPTPNGTITLLGFEACFGDAREQHHLTHGSIVIMAASQLR